MKLHLALLLAALTSPAFAIAADAQLKPGQWNMSVNMQMAGMPQLSAEQIEQMKQMGVDISFLSGKPTIIQQCITPEQATLKKPIDVSSGTDDQCSIKNYKQSGKSVSGNMVCTGDLKANGRFDMTVNSETSYSGKWTLKGVTKEGMPIDQTTDINAKWVKATCDAGIASAP
jgi:hypothetical protein